MVGVGGPHYCYTCHIIISGSMRMVRKMPVVYDCLSGVDDVELFGD